MILPSKSLERHAVYRNEIREAQASQDGRRARTRRLRQLALRGTDGVEDVRRNRLDEWVEQSASYEYAPEAVRLGAVLSPAYGDQWFEEMQAVGEEAQRLFADSGLDMIYDTGVEWANVFDSCFFKVLVSDNQPRFVFIQDPADVSVKNESLATLDEQDAIVHSYEVDLAVFIRMVYASVANETERKLICDEAHEVAVPATTGRSHLAPTTTPPILLIAASPNMQGSAPVYGVGEGDLALPQVQSRVVRLNELWIKDDLAVEICKECHRREFALCHEQGPLYDHQFAPGGGFEWEWRKVQHMPSTERILWETFNPLLEQRQPIKQLRLKDVPDYLYGVSPMQKMINMQKWAEYRIGKDDALLDLQVEPPTGIIGMASVDGEKAKLLFTPRGVFSMPPNPGADIKRFAPNTPPDAMGMTDLIDRWFDRAGGIPHGGTGATDPNVRSAGQMREGASLSSTRMNSKAMRVEDCLEELMTDVMRLWWRMNPHPLRIPVDDPEKRYREFLMSQVPGDFVIRVSAHSASPLFANQMRELAVILKKEGATDLVTFVEMLNPPMREQAIAVARRIQHSQGEQRKKLVEAKTAEAMAKKEQADAKLVAAQRRSGGG